MDEMSDYAAELQKKDIRLGLVPTMGYLHEGHLSLVRLLDGKCDIKGASIFVNPIQFGKGEDMEAYPRDEELDIAKFTDEGCEVVFCPSADDMYPDGFQTYIDVEVLSKPLCGLFRPNHFRGVVTVVNRLFNLTRCSVAAFGLKDYQQAIVIRRMVKDLNIPVELVFGETVREDDGLAMSTRNSYLTSEERTLARLIPVSLNWAAVQASSGSNDCMRILKGMREILVSQPGIDIQYLEAVDTETLQPRRSINNGVQILLAVNIGKTRLIDNCHICHDREKV